MNADEYIKKYIKRQHQKKFRMLALIEVDAPKDPWWNPFKTIAVGGWTYWHVHRNEDVPTKDYLQPNKAIVPVLKLVEEE